MMVPSLQILTLMSFLDVILTFVLISVTYVTIIAEKSYYAIYSAQIALHI